MDPGQMRGLVVATIAVIATVLIIGAAGAGTAAADSETTVDSIDVLEVNPDTDDAETTDDDGDGADDENGDDGADDENGDDGADDENGSDDGDASDGEDGDDSETTDPAPADIRITNVETNAPITVGETIEVDVTLENVGGMDGSGDVTFSLDEYKKDSTTIQLGSGESETVQLSYVSKSGDAQDWTLRVVSPHDTDTSTISVESRDDSSSGGSSGGSSSGSSTWSGGYSASASFDIQSFTVTESATVGDVIELNTTVENTGTIGSEKLVWFTVDGSTVNQTEVELARNDDRTLTYAYNTSELENGTYEISAETPDGVETREIVLDHPRSKLMIENVEAATTVEAGEQLVASVDLYNAANATATDNVSLYLDNSSIDIAAVAVEPQTTTTVELTYRTNAELLGDLNFTVATSESSENMTTTVIEPTPAETQTPAPMAETPDSTAADETEDDAETPTEPDETDDSTPGFGITVTLAALLLALVTIFARAGRQ